MTHIPRFRINPGKRRPTYYYDAGTRGAARWIPLGHNLSEAMRRYADLEARRERVGEDTITAMIDAWFAWPNKRSIRASTLRKYGYLRKHLDRMFGHVRAEQLEAGDVAQYLAECQRRSARHEISLLSMAYDYAVIRRLVPVNPCRSVDRSIARTHKRTRLLTAGEFAAVCAAAPPLHRAAFELSYCTALRRSDIVRLRWDSFGESIPTQKTGARLRFPLTPDIAAILADARAAHGDVVDVRIFPVTANTLSAWWQAAAAKAGVKDSQLRDVRALAATDAKEQGRDAQSLLGHTDARTTRGYTRGLETTTVEPLRRKR